MAKSTGLRVRAKLLQGEGRVVGFYGLRRIREGQEFTLKSAADFSSKWMERVEEDDRRPSERAAALRREASSKNAVELDEESPI